MVGARPRPTQSDAFRRDARLPDCRPRACDRAADRARNRLCRAVRWYGKDFSALEARRARAIALRDGLLVAQSFADHSVFFYAAETFANYVLRLQFRLPGPTDSFGKDCGSPAAPPLPGKSPAPHGMKKGRQWTSGSCAGRCWKSRAWGSSRRAWRSRRFNALSSSSLPSLALRTADFST